MPSPGEYADCLRAIGRLLEAQDAQPIEIQDHEDFLGVAWQGHTGNSQTRGYREYHLAELQAQARAQRGEHRRVAITDWAERLRTVGQHLDGEAIILSSLVADRRGMRLSGLAGGRYLTHEYSPDELWGASKRRRLRRRLAAAP